MTAPDIAQILATLDLVTFKDLSVREEISGHARTLTNALFGNLRAAALASNGTPLERGLADKLATAREKTFIFVAGSTYASEDEFIFSALGDFIRSGAVKVVIAPRKLIRIPALLWAATAKGLKPVKRSALLATDELPPLTILDSIGELPGVYAYADAAFVGGTIRDKGGHNLFEPAACGVPVLFGPHYANNFDFAEELRRSGGGECVLDGGQLRAVIARWLNDRHECRRCGAAARTTMSRGKDVLDATVVALRGALTGVEACAF